MTSIVLIAPFPDCYFHLALLSHYAGSCNEYRSAPSDHSEDHRWSKFVTNQFVFKLTVRREGNIVGGQKATSTDNSFGFHCLRCVYQLHIWRNGLHYVQELKSSSDFRFELDNE